MGDSRRDRHVDAGAADIGFGVPHPSWWQWQLSAEMPPASRQWSLQNFPNGPFFVTRQSHAGWAHLVAVVILNLLTRHVPGRVLAGQRPDSAER